VFCGLGDGFGLRRPSRIENSCTACFSRLNVHARIHLPNGVMEFSAYTLRLASLLLHDP
jgi:hypothetical protein